MNDFKPNIVIFRCNWCSPAGAERALASQLKDNFNPRFIKTSCTGRIDPTFIFDAFAKGADGVMIAGCRLGDCHFVTGNYKAGRNVLLLKRVLAAQGRMASYIRGTEVPFVAGRTGQQGNYPRPPDTELGRF
jgi:coenzyme F420-reducing hydrogenase delta subunit